MFKNFWTFARFQNSIHESCCFFVLSKIPTCNFICFLSRFGSCVRHHLQKLKKKYVWHRTFVHKDKCSRKQSLKKSKKCTSSPSCRRKNNCTESELLLLLMHRNSRFNNYQSCRSWDLWFCIWRYSKNM